MRLTSAITQDIRFQFRHGFYYVYAILTLIYIILLRLLPDALVHQTLTLILFTDICTLGFFFIGAIVILERGQNITESLFVTPLKLSEYLLSKQLSFLLLSACSALLIILGSAIGGQNLLWFGSGVIMSAVLYTQLGLAFAAKAKNVNDYFGRALGIGLLISLPFVAYLGIFDTPLFYIFPTRATLILLDSLSTNISTGEKLYASLSLVLWLFILSKWTYQRFEQHVRHPA